MRLQAQIKAVFLMATIFVFVAFTHAADAVGRVCVQAIPLGESWQANNTGATEHSIFTVQIDKFAAISVSTNSSGVFTNLSLSGQHLVKIQLDGKPLTSFHFTFQERGDHLRLWYNPFYGTWSLSDVRPGEKCACPKPEPSNKSLQATRDGALSACPENFRGSASRFTLVGPACLSSGR